MTDKKTAHLVHPNYLVLLLGLIFSLNGISQPVYENYTFTTFAGPIEVGIGWFDGPTNNSRFNYPEGISVDPSGNIYVADNGNDTIRKISPAGDATTLAGLAQAVGSADGRGANARFNVPESVAVDTNGVVYVTDTGNHTVRKIVNGLVTTIAGLAGSPGTNDGNGAAARFNSPNGIAIDKSGYLYVGDFGNHTIRKIAPDGTVSTLAGLAGISGTNSGTGTGARFNSPCRLAVDGSGTVYVADNHNSAIRKVTAAGVVSTLAGLPGTTGSANGTGTAARFYQPFGVVLDAATNVYVSDTGNHLIRKITPLGVVTTLAGTVGVTGVSNATGTAAQFNTPAGIGFDGISNLYVGDTYNHMVRKVTLAGVVSSFGGSAYALGTNTASGSAARFSSPTDASADKAGNIYVADTANHVIRKITPSGVVSNFAGLPGNMGSVNGTGTAARFNFPNGLTVDSAGNVYVADTSNETIRKITPAGVVTTVAGSLGVVGTNNGTGTLAQFNSPVRIAVDNATNLYVSDYGNDTIRKITPAGVVTTFAGMPRISGTNDGTGTQAQFNNPFGLAVDTSSNLFVADSSSFTIRKITPAGVVTTFVGSPGQSGSNDASGLAARFSVPNGLTINGNNELFVTDYYDHEIRKVTPAGVVTTLAGSPGKTGNINGTGAEVRFFAPFGVAVVSNSILFVVDESNEAIRKGTPALSDVPAVDLHAGITGASRQLSVSNLTTSSWYWNFLRRPAGSVAQLSSATAQNPTFTPDISDLYIFRLQATNAAGQVTIRQLSLTSLAGAAKIDAITRNGGNVILTGSTGTPGGSFTLVYAPDATLPANQWTTSGSGMFDVSGNFTVTNDVSALPATRFYRISAP